MRDVPPTPPATLARARIAREAGLRFVYTGNVHDDGEGGTTYRPGCGAAVIVRAWYDIRRYELTGTGAGGHCGTALAGVYDGDVGHWGRRRLPVTVTRGRR